VQVCLEFAKKFTSSSTAKSDLDFGHNLLPRDLTDAIADSATGKIGELAFKKICASLGFNIGIDFKIKPGRHNTDFGQDINEIEVDGRQLTPLISIDIKTTKSNSQWLLLETHKHWASVLVLIVANLPNAAESNLDAFIDSDIDCSFIGFAYLSDFYDAKSMPWFKYTNGMRLLDPSIVDCMYKYAFEESGAVTLKTQLTKFYSKSCVDKRKIQIGPALKCPEQVGLPRKFLRTTKDELVELMKLISDVSVPKEQVNSEILKSIIKINFHLSTAQKELKS
jgi:hypothetical protein